MIYTPIKTYIITLYDRTEKEKVALPILKFPPIEATNKEEAEKILLNNVIRFESLELYH